MTPERLDECKTICACVPFINNGVGVAETQDAMRELVKHVERDVDRLAEAEKVVEAVRLLREQWTAKHVVNSPLDLKVVECIIALEDYLAAYPPKSASGKEETKA